MFQKVSTTDIPHFLIYLYSGYNLDDFNYALLIYKSEKYQMSLIFLIQFHNLRFWLILSLYLEMKLSILISNQFMLSFKLFIFTPKRKRIFYGIYVFPSLTIFCYYHVRIEQTNIVFNTPEFIGRCCYYINILTEKIFAWWHAELAIRRDSRFRKQQGQQTFNSYNDFVSFRNKSW
jgi:hypothetical protein